MLARGRNRARAKAQKDEPRCAESFVCTHLLQKEESRIFILHISPNSLLLGVLNSFLRCVRPFCHCWCPPFSAGHAAFLFICLPGDFFRGSGCPPCCRTACPPSLRLVTLCLPSLCFPLSPFCLLLILSPFLSPFLLVTESALVSFCFLLYPFLFSFLLVIVSALSPFCLPLSPVLSPFLLVTVSTLSPFCFLLSPVLSLFLLVIVSALSPFCLPLSPFLFAFSLFCFLLYPFLFVTVSVLSPLCFLLFPLLSPLFLVIVFSWSPLCLQSCLPSASFCLPSVSFCHFCIFLFPCNP